MVVDYCCWISRAHGVEDVRGVFSVSMRRRRKGLFWGGDFWRFGGEWWLFGGIFDVVHHSFWLEKEDGLREVDQWDCFLPEWAGFRWVWSPAEKWVMVAVKMEKMGSFSGGCLVAGHQRGDERLRVEHGFKNG
ncbi:hypothetical protein KY290_017167 [Solanum tuberosum]|uniref:Uncharacterized protein n=1 Tax=Solanum tuberosum TaxID=4113 RepID=A0ABQ7VC48_SOLTU|nr:hypothetical protein KY284_016197 [Solanum tuberosum]KAH0701924.1 hypothetical protein KY285_016202 [Solanum tuberosum]KAH0761094.1 hypothetical protein KY290_017167 [Solanum tuberosum]